MINKHWDLTTYCWNEPGCTNQEYGVGDIIEEPIDLEKSMR